MTPKIIVLDTETSGLPDRAGFDKSYPPWAIAHYAKCRVIQLAYQVYEIKRGNARKLYAERNIYIKPNGFIVPPDSIAIHGKTNEFLHEHGIPIEEALRVLKEDMEGCILIVGHNIEFDKAALAAEAWRMSGATEFASRLQNMTTVCTMRAAKEFCGATTDKGAPKFPKLMELYLKLFGKQPLNQHDALGDVKATADCYFQLREMMLVI